MMRSINPLRILALLAAWNGSSFAQQIDGATFDSKRGVFYLFTGDRFAKQAWDKPVEEGYPKQIEGNWTGWPKNWEPSNVDAIVYDSKRDVYYLFKGDEYAKHVLGKPCMEGYPKPITEWNGWPKSWGTGDVDAVVYDSKRDLYYMFKGFEYTKHEFAKPTMDGYPKPIEEWNGWPTSWPKGGVDAVVYDEERDQYILFRDDEYVIHEFAKAPTREYPKKIDTRWESQGFRTRGLFGLSSSEAKLVNAANQLKQQQLDFLFDGLAQLGDMLGSEPYFKSAQCREDALAGRFEEIIRHIPTTAIAQVLADGVKRAGAPFQYFSVGVGASAGVGISGTIEGGGIFKLVNPADAYGYLTYGYSISLTAGGSAMLSVGFWAKDPKDLTGEATSVGMAIGGTREIKGKKVGVGAGLQFWFGGNWDKVADPLQSYVGLTAQVGVSQGLDIPATPVVQRARTHIWKDNKELPGAELSEVEWIQKNGLTAINWTTSAAGKAAGWFDNLFNGANVERPNSGTRAANLHSDVLEYTVTLESMLCLNADEGPFDKELEMFGAVNVIPQGKVYGADGSNGYLFNCRPGDRISISKGNRRAIGYFKYLYVSKQDLASASVKLSSKLMEHDDASQNDNMFGSLDINLRDVPPKGVVKTMRLDNDGQTVDLSFRVTVLNSMPRETKRTQVQNQYADRTLVKGTGSAVYIIAHGKACWIPGPSIFTGMGLDWNAIMTISDASLDALPKSPLLVKGSGPKVYMIEGAQRRWIQSAPIFNSRGLDWDAILTLLDSQLNAIPEGNPIDR